MCTRGHIAALIFFIIVWVLCIQGLLITYGKVAGHVYAIHKTHIKYAGYTLPLNYIY